MKLPTPRFTTNRKTGRRSIVTTDRQWELAAANGFNAPTLAYLFALQAGDQEINSYCAKRLISAGLVAFNEDQSTTDEFKLTFLGKRWIIALCRYGWFDDRPSREGAYRRNRAYIISQMVG